MKIIFWLFLFPPFTVYSQWEELTNIKLGDNPREIISSKDQNSVVVVRLWDSVFISTDYGINWELLHSDINASYTDVHVSQNYIALSKWDTLLVTSDFGNSWIYINLPFFVVEEFSMIDSNIIINSPYYSIHWSNDYGDSWTDIDKYDDEDYMSDCWQSGSPHCHSIHTDGSFLGINGNNIFYNLTRVDYGEGRASAVDKGLHKSWNFGKDWSPLNLFGVNSIDFFYPKIYASTSNGFYRSDNYGSDWEKIHTESFLVFTVLQNNIIGLTSDYIVVSNDFGETWLQYDKELDYNENSEFAINEKYIYASIENRIYRKEIADYPLGIANNSINNRILIYPNPTNGYINIDSNNIVFIEIIDLLGQSVITVSEVKNYIDLVSLSNGVYFIRLRLNNDKDLVIKIVKK